MNVQRLAVYAESAITVLVAIARYVMCTVRLRREERAADDAAWADYTDHMHAEIAEIAQWRRDHPDDA